MSNLKLAAGIGLAALLALTGGAEAGRVVTTRGGGDGGNHNRPGDAPVVVTLPDNPQVEPPKLSCKFKITPYGVVIVWENTGGALPPGAFLEATVEGTDFAAVDLYLDKTLAKGGQKAGLLKFGNYWTADKFEGKACIASYST